MSRNSKFTISDIAQAAGVSKTTVSRYINGQEDMLSQSTRERVKAVIEMSHYQPSDAARSLKMKKTNLIGVAISDISSPFSSALMIGIGGYLTEKDYTPLFVHCEDSIEKEEKLVDMLMARDVAGIIVNTTSMSNSHLIKLACDKVPVVLCDRYVDGHRFNIVTTETDESIYSLVEHLQNQGYTRPVLFTQCCENNSSRIRRRDAFIAAVNKLYGYKPENDIYELNHRKGFTAENQLEKLINSMKPGDIPAVVGTNSNTTVSAYKAIIGRKLKIPEEIGLCGPEDWDWQSDVNWPLVLTPCITTLYIPSIRMGMECAELLLKIIHEDMPPRQIQLPCELRVRGSTCRKGLFEKDG